MSNNKYLTYEEFINMSGSEALKQASFNLLEAKAESIINYYTFGRLKGLATQVSEVKNCMFELITIENQIDRTNGKASEGIDGYSVSYLKNSEYRQQEYEKIYFWLSNCKLDDGTPYLYVGGVNDNKRDYIHIS